YHHLIRGGKQLPELITDFLGYNTALEDWEVSAGISPDHPRPEARNWVGDLLIECEIQGRKPEGEVVLEMSKGIDRFRARWKLAAADGHCELIRVARDREQRLEERPTSLRPGKAQRIRFANIDDRLLVWVDSDLPFGEGVAYEAGDQGPYANDLEPAS